MKHFAAFFLGLGLLVHSADAADAVPDLKEPGWKLVALKNGLNTVDVNSDGRPDMIVVARRENYNAHGFDMTTIYIWGPDSAVREKGDVLQIVPVDPQENKKRTAGESPLFLTTSGGADGLLHDFRLLIDAEKHAAVLVTATRQFGGSFADSRPVTFEFFALTHNAEGVVGWPTFYFKSYKKEKSKKAYQDVGEAFKGELGIESDGR